MDKAIFNPDFPVTRYFWLGLALAAVIIRGLWIDVMDVDASQYASISQEMLNTGSWLQVYFRGEDYLDKPPLLFWLSTASFKLFGVSNWSYKLPSVLGALAGVLAVFRFTRLFYSLETARQAAFILASSLAVIVICNDVRTDTLLLGFTACAVWQLAEYLEFNRWRNLVGAFAFIGLAMLAKGPIGLIIPGFAVGTHLLLTGRYRDIFRWQWLPGLAVTALVLAPMCWGLWQQFDMHPEKVIDGRQGVSGLYFYFWEQSFGRITGENKWENDASALYFTHVYLWAFLPWCLLLPGAWWRYISQRFRKNNTEESGVQYYALGAFTLGFIALSMSRYKLPHYIFVTLPWAAVMVAAQLNRPVKNAVRNVHWVLLYVAAFIGIIISFWILSWIFPTRDTRIWGTALLLCGSFLLFIYNRTAPSDSTVLVQRGVLAAVLIGFVLNFHFYPRLLPYQSAAGVIQFARSKGVTAEKMAYFHRGSNALDFYNGQWMPDMETPARVYKRVQESGPFWIFADDAGKGELELSGIKFEVEGTFSHFKVAQLTFKFLNPERRSSTLDTVYLLHILDQR